MFKNAIKYSIKALRTMYELLEETYELTYSELSKELTKEVNKRKKENKKEFIERTIDFITKKHFKDTGSIISKNIAREFANEFFKIAKIKGDVNEFNRLELKGEYDD